MYGVFSGCSSLEKLNISNFNTKKVLYVQNMFSELSPLKSLDISRFNSDNLISMWNMFNNCNSLFNLDISKFNLKKVEYMKWDFQKYPDELTEKVKAENKYLKDEAF